MKAPKVLLNKGILLLFGLLFSLGIKAQQSFEGTVTYNIQVSGKDASVYLLNKPPNRLTIHIKDNNFIVKLSGGRIPRTFLFIPDSNHTFIVDIPESRYFKRTYFRDTSSYKPIVAPTGKTRDIKGRNCQEYMVKRKDRKEIDLFYVTDEYKVDTTLFQGMDKAKADFLVPGLGGRIPLMKVIKTPRLETSLELVSIKAQEFPIEAFRIPPGFSNKKKRDPRK